jgi:hypothetical protein
VAAATVSPRARPRNSVAIDHPVESDHLCRGGYRGEPIRQSARLHRLIDKLTLLGFNATGGGFGNTANVRLRHEWEIERNYEKELASIVSPFCCVQWKRRCQWE